MLRSLLRIISTWGVYILRPIKLFAYRTRSQRLKGFLLEVTTFVDFVTNFIHGQNEVMLLHQRIYGGNFIFGKGVMVTDYPTMAAAVPQPSHRTNLFMGINVVSGNEVFVTNSPMIAQGEPFRTLARNDLEENLFTPEVRALDYTAIKDKSAHILEEWLADPEASEILKMRSVATRLFVFLLSGITITKEDSESITAAYLRHFAELSLFHRYLPIVTGILGSERLIKKDAFYKLREYGVNNNVIDATLFAAMFSCGTLFVRCVGDIRRHGIDYQSHDEDRRRRFILEALRLFPTVTTTHRVVEKNETVRVCNRDLELIAGDQVVYPFVCAHQDTGAFGCPHKMDIERPQEEYDKILSWSDGPHMCPAKEMSILVTMVMLDTLGSKQPLAEIDYGDRLIR